MAPQLIAHAHFFMWFGKISESNLKATELQISAKWAQHISESCGNVLMPSLSWQPYTAVLPVELQENRVSLPKVLPNINPLVLSTVKSEERVTVFESVADLNRTSCRGLSWSELQLIVEFFTKDGTELHQ